MVFEEIMIDGGAAIHGDVSLFRKDTVKVRLGQSHGKAIVRSRTLVNDIAAIDGRGEDSFNLTPDWTHLDGRRGDGSKDETGTGYVRDGTLHTVGVVSL